MRKRYVRPSCNFSLPFADLSKVFRDHPVYRLEQPPLPEEVRPRQGGRKYQSTSPMQRSSPGRMLPSPQSASRRANADLCSIFVGNLPPNATDPQLREMFSIFGPIIHVEIVRKPSVHGTSISFLPACESTNVP